MTNKFTHGVFTDFFWNEALNSKFVSTNKWNFSYINQNDHLISGYFALKFLRKNRRLTKKYINHPAALSRGLSDALPMDLKSFQF